VVNPGFDSVIGPGDPLFPVTAPVTVRYNQPLPDAPLDPLPLDGSPGQAFASHTVRGEGHRPAFRAEGPPAAQLTQLRTESRVASFRTCLRELSLNEPTYKTALIIGASGLIGQARRSVRRAGSRRTRDIARGGSAEPAAGAHGLHSARARHIRHPALERLIPGLQVDLLINNAGVAAAGSLHTGDPAAIDQQIDVNLRAVMHTSRLVLPGMVERDRGHIVMVGSMSGHHNFPGHAAYHATKAAIPRLSRQLRLDLFGKRVRVTEIARPVKTGIFAKVAGPRRERGACPFLRRLRDPAAQDIADAAVYAVGAPQHVNVALIDLMPTMQVPGGIRIARSLAADATG
jgi:NADP-dependent 3-hydroxy acid dehydrogenase YdfG